jgi:hypothetical protein
VEDAAQTRQSRRQRIKTSKAMELENQRKQDGNPVRSGPFAWQNQRSNEAWDQGENYESATGSGLEVAIPDAPRPIRIQNRPRTPPRRRAVTFKGWKGASDKKTLASIFGALEDLKAGNTKLREDYTEIKAGNAELIASNAEIIASAGELMKELAEIKAQLAETKA